MSQDPEEARREADRHLYKMADKGYSFLTWASGIELFAVLVPVVAVVVVLACVGFTLVFK